MAERSGEVPLPPEETGRDRREAEPIPIRGPQEAAGAAMPAAEEAIREGQPVSTTAAQRPESPRERIPQPPREPGRRILGREWESPPPERVAERILGDREAPGILHWFTATKTRREILRMSVRIVRIIGLGGIASWLGWRGYHSMMEKRGAGIREEGDIRAWTHLLKNKETVEAVKSILNKHLTKDVDPNHKEGWKGIFGEEARGIGKVIEMALRDREALREQYSAEGLDDFFSWVEAKEEVGEKINYKALRNEYWKKNLGAEGKDLVVLDQLWNVYEQDPGKLTEAIRGELDEQQEKAPKPESRKPVERDWIAQARKIAQQQASRSKKV